MQRFLIADDHHVVLKGISLPKIQTSGLVNFFCNLTISNEKANTSKIFASFQGPGGA